MHIRRQDYIPAGCIRVSSQELELPPGGWAAQSSQRWQQFRRPLSTDLVNEHGTEFVSSDLQDAIFTCSRLQWIARLYHGAWIDLQLYVNNIEGHHGILRVYLLPDDVHRALVDRTSIGLRKARHQVLHSLDFSKETWQGRKTIFTNESSSLVDVISRTSNDETSLLQVFNKIPSPRPNAESVEDDYARDAINDLLESAVPGLTSMLYPYQRRSTAVMLQKEAAPGKVLDPRLVLMHAQDGSPWYVDPVVGSILTEPRFYDGVSGGILAEEMGSGKTIICLALILSTKNLATRPPDLYKGAGRPRRRRVASLADMAASCATRNAVSWKSYFSTWSRQLGYEFNRCEEALNRNPGYYFRPPPKLRRTGRHPVSDLQPTKLFLSRATVVVVPNNLLNQWKQEIAKHTTGLDVIVFAKNEPFPDILDLLTPDIILFSQSRFEKLVKQDGGLGETPLISIHFKRCIVDEGHKLGNSKIGRKSNLLIGLDSMSFSSRWIVTGTPSHGLFGVDDRFPSSLSVEGTTDSDTASGPDDLNATSAEMERKDLERLGSISALYLKSRPWANLPTEGEDSQADWATYLMLPRHSRKGHGRWDCLKTTLNALIIRHQLAEVGDLLPPVDEKVVVLEGSYQDRLSLNLFAMMIIFNSVQSQRTDMDYFFHQRQRKSLLEIVHNLKQSSFFGGSFFTSEEILKSVETAKKFLEEGKVEVGEEDRQLLHQAIALGQVALEDTLRMLSNRFHEMPIWVDGFPVHGGHAWSLDGEIGNPICTSASMLLTLQRILSAAAHEPESLNSLLNGGLIQEGITERTRILDSLVSDKKGGEKEKKAATLAGNTRLGQDSHRKPRPTSQSVKPRDELQLEKLPPELQRACITSTVSAKLSYLVDSVLRYQEGEKIIIFYENDNVAWYLAGMLDVVCFCCRYLQIEQMLMKKQLQVQHLIYAKTLTIERKAQYVNTFHHNPTFRCVVEPPRLDSHAMLMLLLQSVAHGPVASCVRIRHARSVSSLLHQPGTEPAGRGTGYWASSPYQPTEARVCRNLGT